MEEWFPLGTFPKCCFVPYKDIAGLPSLVRRWEEITSRVNMVPPVYRLSSAIRRVPGSSHSSHCWTNSVLQYTVIIGVLNRPLCLRIHKRKTESRPRIDQTIGKKFQKPSSSRRFNLYTLEAQRWRKEDMLPISICLYERR